MERTLVQSLDELIAAEKSKLEQVIKIAERVNTSLGNRNLSQPDEVYTSALEVYSLFKRFVFEWKRLEGIVDSNKSKGKLDSFISSKLFFLEVQ